MVRKNGFKINLEIVCYFLLKIKKQKREKTILINKSNGERLSLKTQLKISILYQNGEKSICDFKLMNTSISYLYALQNFILFEFMSL